MMGFHCRWKTCMICLCAPCIVVVLLFSYITIWICYDMAPKETNIQKPPPTPAPTIETHFIAHGTYKNADFAPLPSTFWPLQLYKGVIWNQLQLTVDRHFNPILNPKSSWVNKRFEAKISESFKAIPDLDSRVSTWSQPINDFIRYMHKRDYPVLLQPHRACGVGAKEDTNSSLLLLAIKSTDQNFVRRQVIRQSWGQVGWVAGQRRNLGEEGVEGSSAKYGGYIRRVFLLGRENQDSPESQFVKWESNYYGDILRWDFKDSFFNLTLKDILFWDWFSQHCNRVHFILKGDDDVFVNTPVMVDYLQEQLSTRLFANMRSFMVGDVLTNTLPVRDTDSKYYIPESFYQGYYPAYGGGGGVVYSGILARRLNHLSRRVHLYPIDDAYVGMCLVRLKVSPVHNPAFLTLGFPKGEKELPCVYHSILLLHKREPHKLIKMWADLQAKADQCWNVTLRSEPKDDKTKNDSI